MKRKICCRDQLNQVVCLRGFLGVVSQPGIFSFLELGYIYDRKGKKHPVQKVDFPIWNFGEGGVDPDDYGFRFKAGDLWYDIQVSLYL